MSICIKIIRDQRTIMHNILLFFFFRLHCFVKSLIKYFEIAHVLLLRVI
jgi:hypothetical protein